MNNKDNYYYTEDCWTVGKKRSILITSKTLIKYIFIHLVDKIDEIGQQQKIAMTCSPMRIL